MTPTKLDPATEQLCVDTIRTLTIDAVEKARSGHPGGVMGVADAAFVLWHDFLRWDPGAPDWSGRDRFVLSAGHMSMLVYSLLHLSGGDITLDDIREFRQWGAKTAGHPEYGLAQGIEVTAGPLGNGFAHGVGMALAARMAGARFADDEGSLIDSRVFLVASDGDLMEGVALEAASLAGHLKLGNLVTVWDDNRITIEGSTELAFTEDVTAKFEATGWATERVDGHDREALRAAIGRAVEDPSRPHLIASRTHIAHGSPGKVDTAGSHGAPLGPEEVIATKRNLGWPEDAEFLVPAKVAEVFHARARACAEEREAWQSRLDAWREADAAAGAAWDEFWSREVPADLLDRVLDETRDLGSLPTRKHSQAALQEVARHVPAVVGGSADLAPSNSVGVKESTSIVPASAQEPGKPDPSFAGRNIHFGIREHGMGAMVNGMALFGGFRPYAATYLVFSDYLRPALRLAALQEIPAVYLFSHDSFRVGEDGPTHQPVEHLWALRAIPGLVVFRPADAVETSAAWCWAAATRERPVAIVVSRQKVPALEHPEDFDPKSVLAGAYVHADPEGAGFTIVATGSEVALAVEAAAGLEKLGVRARIVSMPSVELFLEQSPAAQDRILPRSLPVVTLEAGSTTGWYRFTGRDGLAVGIDHFGASAPAGVLDRRFGFTAPDILDRIHGWWKSREA